MASPVHRVDEQIPLEEAVAVMSRAGTRRLIVTSENNRLVGLLRLDDVLRVLVEEVAAIGRLVEQQKPRIPA
jgi:predicted transcriptional regulator